MIVTTGNIHNDELLRLFSGNLELLVSVLESAHLVELGQDGVEVFEAPST